MSDPFFDADRMSGDYPEKGHYKDQLIDELDARAEPAPQWIGISGEIDLPHDLHQETKWLVVRFAEALASKLSHAQRKYGYSDGWKDPNWMDECRSKLVEHLAKGDPRDVANYCAFLWYHKQPTVAVSAAPLPADVAEMVDRLCSGDFTATEILEAADMLERQQHRIAELEAQRERADIIG